MGTPNFEDKAKGNNLIVLMGLDEKKNS